MKEKVLVTGSEGFVGLHLREIMDFTGLDVDTKADLVTDISGIGKFADVLKSVETIIHLADIRFQHITESNIGIVLERHKHFVDAIKGLPNLKRIIYASSCGVYGMATEKITELSSPNVTSAYAKAKLHVESYLKELDKQVVILRFGTAYGGTNAFRNDIIINELVEAAKTESEYEIYGASCWRPYINVTDFARALAFFADTRRNFEGLFNVVESNHTKKEILNQIKDQDLSCERIKIVDSSSEARDYNVGNEKVSQMGFTFDKNLNNGLKEVIDNYNVLKKKTVAPRDINLELLENEL